MLASKGAGGKENRKRKEAEKQQKGERERTEVKSEAIQQEDNSQMDETVAEKKLTGLKMKQTQMLEESQRSKCLSRSKKEKMMNIY